VEDRDINAALNILKLGIVTVGHTGTWEKSLKASGDLSSTFVGENLHEQDGSVNEESPD
jgi:putative transposase